MGDFYPTPICSGEGEGIRGDGTLTLKWSYFLFRPSSLHPPCDILECKARNLAWRKEVLCAPMCKGIPGSHLLKQMLKISSPPLVITVLERQKKEMAEEGLQRIKIAASKYHEKNGP